MTFDEVFAELLEDEGDYSDHPNDPGGKTRYGITEAVARRAGYRGHMRDLPLDLAKRIARAEYWDAVRADELPAPIRYAVFDAAYNSGPEQSIKWLQRACGVADDGQLGPKTLAAAWSKDPELLEAQILGKRLRFMADLKNWQSFSRGWARRVADLLEAP